MADTPGTMVTNETGCLGHYGMRRQVTRHLRHPSRAMRWFEPLTSEGVSLVSDEIGDEFDGVLPRVLRSGSRSLRLSSAIHT